MWQFKSKLFTLITFICLHCFPVYAMEYIENFHSDITVNQDASLTITENIKIHHEGMEVKKGIIRELSTLKGERYEILYVLRNSIQEPWHKEYDSGSILISIGDDNDLENPGNSEYTISYIMYDTLRPIKNSNLNELYLNVTGNWSLPINKVSAIVNYPPQTEIHSQYAYVTDQEAIEFSPGAEFILTNIPPYHEATIAQSFVKGTVNIPLPQIYRWLILAFIATLLYFLFVWSIWGKDPTPRPIVPDWQVPQNLTPLECAYIDKNGARPSNAFFLHIIWLLNQKIINIMEQEAPTFLGKKKTYTLTANNIDKKPKNEEIKSYLKNFPNVLTLTSSPSQKVSKYNETMCHNIENKMENKYYHRRNILTIIGALIFPLIWVNIFPETAGILFIIGIFLLPQIMSKKLWPALLIAITVIFFTFTFTQNASLTGIFGSYLLIIALFQHLMFQPTIIGQRQKERIEGLKMFLTAITNTSIAQNDDNKSSLKGLSKDKRLTPEDMEKLFPYAVALGLEKEWEKKYAAAFGKTALSTFTTSHAYSSRDFQSRLTGSCNQTTSYTSPHSSGAGSSGFGHAGGGFGGGGGRGR